MVVNFDKKMVQMRSPAVLNSELRSLEAVLAITTAASLSSQMGPVCRFVRYHPLAGKVLAITGKAKHVEQQIKKKHTFCD